MKPQTKIRKFSLILLTGILVYAGLMVVSVIVMTFFPVLELNTWLLDTAIYWLIFRLFLYAIIANLIYKIQQHSSRFPRKTRYLILCTFVLIEGLNVLYRL